MSNGDKNKKQYSKEFKEKIIKINAITYLTNTVQ